MQDGLGMSMLCTILHTTPTSFKFIVRPLIAFSLLPCILSSGKPDLRQWACTLTTLGKVHSALHSLFSNLTPLDSLLIASHRFPFNVYCTFSLVLDLNISIAIYKALSNVDCKYLVPTDTCGYLMSPCASYNNACVHGSTWNVQAPLWSNIQSKG